ncbi:MAG: hypothetical protein AUI14_20760 [Actinobacteria bacterium 13_2_20CM_2_71_6]|nr:MAG: hypothetical protein AUI14_20760 [Actinobacteria bacterium 13_2_20CM_2_71_6]
MGPAIAGAVTELLGWRWVFIGLAILVVVSAAAPVRLLGRLAPVPVEAPRSPTGRVGAAGVVAVGAGLLQYAASGWDLVHLAFAAAGIAALVPSVTRLFPEGTLRAARGLPTMVLLRGISSGIYFTLESFVPLLLINQRHVSVTLAGISFTGATLSWAFAAWLQGHPWSAVPRHRLVFTGSAVIVGSALIATVSVIGTVPPLLASVALIVAGFGMGLVLPSLTVLTLDHSRPEDQGRYSAALQAAQGLGSVVVIGAAGALFNAGTRLGLPGNTVYGAVFAAVVVISIPACLLALRTRVVGHADTTAPAG